MGQRFWNVTCQRALQLLEFDPREPKDTIRDTARYLIRELDLREKGATFVQGTKSPRRVSPENVLPGSKTPPATSPSSSYHPHNNTTRTVTTRLTRVAIAVAVVFVMLYLLVSLYANAPLSSP